MFNILIQCLWIIASTMIFVCGVYFSFKLNFIHLNFKEMFNAIKKKSDGKDTISFFQSLTMALAGRIGVGSLSGIALAIYLGGPGVLLWIWLTSFLCATNAFAESVLAVIFRKKDSGNVYRGGPFYYISDGIGNNNLALLYAFIILIAYIGGFLTIQVNTISKCVGTLVSLNPFIIGLIVAVLSGVTIFGGVKKIAVTTSKLVPIMTVFYLSICFYIIITNITMLPQILINIINSAFNFKAFGTGILSTLLIGMQKGIFSSEVGLGTGSIVAVTADTKSPSTNGLVQAFGIHVENLLFATITVFVICMSNYQDLIITDPNGIEITIYAFKQYIGNIAPLIIAIIIALFGFSTILTGYYYGESSLKFIKKTSKMDIVILKGVTLIVLVIGSIVSSNLLWTIIDIMVGIIAIINVYALFKLRNVVIDEYKDYEINKNIIN